MLINLTIPVYNEEAQLAASVRRVVEWLGKVEVSPNAAGPVGWEVVMAENGSSDGTRSVGEALVRELAGNTAGVRVELQWRTEAGRGGALKAAWQGSAAEVLLSQVTDAGWFFDTRSSELWRRCRGRC